MAPQTPAAGASGGASAESLPQVLYLWMPLAVAAVLIFLAHYDLAFYRVYIGSEEVGALEFAHVVVPLISVIYCLRILRMPEARADRLIVIWIVLGMLGCIYIAGEEASWGQHYVGWSTPEFWQAVNDQGETNFHNISSWLDQKPRTLLEFGVIIGGIIIPLLALRRPQIREGRFAVFLPPLVCLPVAVIAEFAKVWERLQGHGLWDIAIFYRASEIQELYFAFFILFYLIVFRQRLLALRVTARH
ncbi:hypothetical protein HBA54_19945 [Pelagibius litoralis]|uniref:Uncharacterized protein n=1 Tax=Pelagibius litoralis TaxID=374515 RepID=A0A967KH36_9PROT|nr:hypothetical protein [Pelagibius litoralis]NIA70876.1 hypothetical protein [Pelagibius litoralis]